MNGLPIALVVAGALLALAVLLAALRLVRRSRRVQLVPF
jgi:hypothetical protein